MPTLPNPRRSLFSVGDAASWTPLLALGVLPVLVVFFSGSPFYNPVGYIDPWLYTGYFNNLTELNQNLGWNNYYISRISWIIPGYLVYRLPSTRVAYWVLHVSLCYTTLIFFYFFLKTRYGKSTAVVGFALLAANPLFLMAGCLGIPGRGCHHVFRRWPLFSLPNTG